MEDNLQAIATVAKLEITLQNLTELMTHIQEYHSIFSPLFLRREHREHSQFFLTGLFLQSWIENPSSPWF